MRRCVDRACKFGCVRASRSRRVTSLNLCAVALCQLLKLHVDLASRDTVNPFTRTLISLEIPRVGVCESLHRLERRGRSLCRNSIANELRFCTTYGPAEADSRTQSMYRDSTSPRELALQPVPDCSGNARAAASAVASHEPWADDEADPAIGHTPGRRMEAAIRRCHGCYVRITGKDREDSGIGDTGEVTKLRCIGVTCLRAAPAVAPYRRPGCELRCPTRSGPTTVRPADFRGLWGSRSQSGPGL